MQQMKQALPWFSLACATSVTNMVDLNIRNADEGDLTFILQLEASPNGRFVQGDSHITHQQQLADPAFRYLIGEHEGERVGYAILVTHADNVMEWRRLMISKADGGFGTKFMRETINTVLEGPTETIKLDVYSENERARHIYKKLGFKETHTAPCPRDNSRTVVFMELAS